PMPAQEKLSLGLPNFPSRSTGSQSRAHSELFDIESKPGEVTEIEVKLARESKNISTEASVAIKTAQLSQLKKKKEKENDETWVKQGWSCADRDAKDKEGVGERYLRFELIPDDPNQVLGDLSPKRVMTDRVTGLARTIFTAGPKPARG